MPVYYIPIIVMFIILFVVFKRNRSTVIKEIIKKKKTKGAVEMIELSKKFIGKECLIYSFDGNRQFTGTILEVSDRAILIENNGQNEAINIDFVIRIREYPKNKKGKKQSVVLD